MDEITQLRAKIEEYDDLYYNFGKSPVSDAEYDTLKRSLRDLENEHPELDISGSVSQRVGAPAPVGRFSELEHPVRLESLQDVFDFDELRKFNDSVVKTLGEQPEYVVEPKVDGLSVAAEYVKGKLSYVATRGDGSKGENLPQKNITTIKNLPKTIKKAPPRLIIRGEVYMSYEDFNGHSSTQVSLFATDEPESNYKNPRNAAAGMLMKKYSEFENPEQDLSIVVFDILLAENLSIDRHEETLKTLESFDFPTIPRTVHPDMECAILAVEELGRRREGFEFATDGAVIKVNNLEQRKTLGSTSRAPRWAVAFKYPPEQKTSVVQDIVIQVGRTGVLTPKATLSPVRLSGTTVTNATLHNADFITEKDVRVGDTVFVRKAGEIIPEVVSVDTSKRPANAAAYVFPTECPECGAPAVRVQDEAAVKCTNAECPVRLAGNLQHFASRSAMDIEGLGENSVKKLLELKLARYCNDIYLLSHEDILRLCDNSTLLANKLTRAIEKSKGQGLSRLLFALGIPHLGQRGAKLLAEHFGSMEALSAAALEDITAVRDIGGTIAASVFDWLHSEHGMTIITSLRENGVKMT